MPVQQGIVGPIPEGADAEAYDKLRRRVLWTMPSGLYVIGSRHGDRASRTDEIVRDDADAEPRRRT